MKPFELGRGVVCDLEKLVDSRLLVQANSGGGKSQTIRRLLEQTHGQVQHLVIDPEGEFSTLRERFDYVLAARHHGDTVADPRAAALLAERLLELGASAVLDIYELKAHERIRFVRLFLEALVNARKELWHPALVVVDEAHVFCPQAGEAESAGAVIDLATRGRKRGFCAVLATQRLSKLHKDAAAECNNKLIGRTGLDVDQRRAGDELGFPKDRWRELRDLEAGDFFAFGPALSREVRRIHVGPVQTSHPKAGARLAAPPPPPTAKVRALLPKLADLPAEAEERIRSLADAQREVAELRRKLTLAQRGAPVVPAKEKIVEKRVEVPALRDGQVKRLEGAAEKLAGAGVKLHESGVQLMHVAKEIAQALGRLNGHRPVSASVSSPTRLAATSSAIPVHRPVPSPVRVQTSPRVSTSAADGISRAQQKLLDAVAELEVLGVEAPTRHQLGMVAGYNLTGGSGAQHIADLGAAGLVAILPGRVQLTDAGRAAADPVRAPASLAELHERVFAKLTAGQRRIAEHLIAMYPETISRAELGAAVGYNLTGGSGAQHVADLITVGAACIPAPGRVAASDLLFPASLMTTR